MMGGVIFCIFHSYFFRNVEQACQTAPISALGKKILWSCSCSSKLLRAVPKYQLSLFCQQLILAYFQGSEAFIY